MTSVRKLAVGISGFPEGGKPGPGTGVAKCIRADPDLDVTIVGLARNELEACNGMEREVDKACTVPCPLAQPQDHIARLAQIREEVGLDILVPCLGADLPLYISYAMHLRSRGIATLLPSVQQFRLRGRDCLARIASRLGVRLPQTTVVTSSDMLQHTVKSIGGPILLQGLFDEVGRAHTIHDASSRSWAITATWDYPIAVQQAVPGDEVNVAGLGDGKGAVLGVVGLKKTATVSLSKVTPEAAVRDPRLLDAARHFCRVYRWKGPFELEFIVRDDEFYLIKVNSTFPSWTYLAAGLGVNLPSLLVRSCLHLPIPPLCALV